jgi:cell division protein FtsX
MKKILIVAATAGLMSLAACNSGTTNTTAENVADNHEANAAIYEDAADNATNATVENVLENAADVEENAADAAEANAH